MIAILVAGYYFRPQGSDEPAAQNQLLSDAVTAVAASEDADYAKALSLWRQLSKQAPDQEAFQLNEAVTVLKWIDENNKLLASGRVTDAARKAELEQELDEGLTRADEILSRLEKSGIQDQRGVLLRAALMEAKSNRLPYPASDEVLRQAAAILAASLKKNPAQPQVAFLFAELVEKNAVAQADPEYAAINADALFASWQSMPRNLALLQRAGKVLLLRQDARLEQLLEPSVELTRHLWTDVSREVQQLKPDTLVTAAKTAIAAGDWTAVRKTRLPLWLNVLTGKGSLNTAFRSDGRLINPDIMAFLETSFLSELSTATTPDPRRKTGNQELPNYRRTELPPASLLHWFDADVNLLVDLALVSGKQLAIYPMSESGLGEEPAAVTELDISPTGLLAAEFFEVDDPESPKVNRSVAELVEGADASQSTSSEGDLTEEQIKASNRHDALQSLLLWGAEGVQIVEVVLGDDSNITSLQPVGETGLEDLQSVTAAVAFDMESDGDLDLLFSTTQGCRLFQNNGNRTFTDFTDACEFPTNHGFDSLALGDYDGDLDQDVIAVSRQASSPILLENLLHGQFRESPLDDPSWPDLNQANSIAVAELDGNGSWDLLLGSWQMTEALFSRFVSPGSVRSLRHMQIPLESGALRVADLDNDSFLDIIGLGVEGVSVGMGFEGGWAPPSTLDYAISQSVQPGTVAPFCLDIADCNLDGWLDIAVCGNAEQPTVVLTAEPSNQNGYLAARLRGRNDDNGGGRVNHFAIGTTLELWNQGRQSRRIVQTPSTHFGLGQSDAQNLRVVFPNGLTQNAESPPSNALIEERQELKGSCPFLYGWDGSKFTLITDLLWNAPLGLQIARGELMPDRRWEHLAIPGEVIQQRDGFYEIRITEELWEVAYFDLVQLTAVDHPIGTQLLTNEKVGPPTIAEPQLFVASKRVRPTRATTQTGADVLELLSEQDRNYVTAFSKFICQGFTEPHFIELDFDESLRDAVESDADLRLALNGWLHPTDTSLNIHLSQDPALTGPEPPSLWIVGTDGNWKCARPIMGFPGGKPKTIVVDLNGVFESDDRRIRIGSSQQLYWDHAYIAVDASQPEVQSQTLELDSADLRYRGFSKLLPRDSDQPHWYDYQDVSQVPKWPELEGPFTRFGDVTQILENDDDKMVVITAGDEIRLRFRLPENAIPNGWQRDFVLHCTGWDKDADLNTMAGQGSLPLPSKDQIFYPPSLADEASTSEVWRKNADNLTRQRQYPKPALGVH